MSGKTSIARTPKARLSRGPFVPLQSVEYRGGSIALAPVESSNLGAIGFSDLDLVLVVHFRSGGVYAYRGVELPVHRALLAAKSKGEYFHRHIAHRYPFERLDVASTGSVRQP